METRIAAAIAQCRFPPAPQGAALIDSCRHFAQQWEKRGMAVIRIRSRRAKSTPHTGSVIFAHGLGDTGQGWAYGFVEMAERMPHVEFIFPTARVVPVTCNGGMAMPSWYDIVGLDVNRLKMDAPGIVESRAFIHSLITIEQETVKSSRRVVVGGFSQGAALSLFAGHTFDAPLGGLIALSGYCTQLKQLRDEASLVNKQAPLLMCHGQADMVVPFALAEESFKWLVGPEFRADASKAAFESFGAMGHESCPLEMEKVEEFLLDVLPPVASKL